MLTQDVIDGNIARVDYHHFPGTTVTVCCIQLINGFSVIGQSACVDEADYDFEMGCKIAYQKAEDEVWKMLGFAARDNLVRVRLEEQVAAMFEDEEEEEEEEEFVMPPLSVFLIIPVEEDDDD